MTLKSEDQFHKTSAEPLTPIISKNIFFITGTIPTRETIGTKCASIFPHVTLWSGQNYIV